MVVAEELCTGSRYYDKLVPESRPTTVEAMLDDIADKYLDINCACFTPNPGRIDDVLRLAEEYKVDGIVHYALQFCAPYTDRGDVGGTGRPRGRATASCASTPTTPWATSASCRPGSRPSWR